MVNRRTRPRKSRVPSRAKAGINAKAVSGASDNGLKTFAMHSLDPKSAPLVEHVGEETALSHAFAPMPVTEARLDSETAATRYLHQALRSKAVPAFTAPQVGGADSEFKSLGTETVPLTDTKIVKFRQTYNRIPVYGSLVTVELDDQNKLVSLDSALGEPRGVKPVAKISPVEAIKAVQKYPGYRKRLEQIVPHLHYYFDKQKAKWRLVFILEDVPVTPEANKGGTKLALLRMDYVVDAQTGSVVAQLPRTPSVASVKENGEDEWGQAREIMVEKSGKTMLLRDSQTNIQTFDFTFHDPVAEESKLPGKAIRKPPSPWPPAAVSAHANAEAVAEFLRTVLKRNNIDNRGGPMNSSINCVVSGDGDDGRQWLNAFWNGHQMVYGQQNEGNKLFSLAADLDVVGHEMFHGVTDSTARLEYANQSGALNESYSDIFGVIITNIGNPDPEKWDWEIGKGFSPHGQPFRDMRDPGRFGQPADMKHFQHSPNTEDGDWGGVHTNSGIHNKAAFLILTAHDSRGNLVSTPGEVAALFYLSVTQHLSRTSQFSDSRRGVLLSARTLFRSLPAAQQQAKLSAIENAFTVVGIK